MLPFHYGFLKHHRRSVHRHYALRAELRSFARSGCAAGDQYAAYTLSPGRRVRSTPQLFVVENGRQSILSHSNPKVAAWYAGGARNDPRGGRVYAHCAGGRHRGVAMGACILVAQGHSPLDAMKLIKERRSFADPHIYYIRNQILRFALEWQSLKAGFRDAEKR